MKILAALAAAMLFMLPAAVGADELSDKLQDKLRGVWLAARQFEGSPRTELHFTGNQVRIENCFEKPVTVKYKFIEKNADDFTITFEHCYKVLRGNGRYVDSKTVFELLYHVEDGRPILSERVFEYDGRGLIIWQEYLRKEDFNESLNGFESKLKQKLNSRKPIPTVMGE